MPADREGIISEPDHQQLVAGKWIRFGGLGMMFISAAVEVVDRLGENEFNPMKLIIGGAALALTGHILVRDIEQDHDTSGK
jgi:hypothetical protein